MLQKHVMSPLMGCRTRDYARMLRQYGVHGRYLPRALVTLLLSLAGAPLRWYERKTIPGKIRPVEVSNPLFIVGFWRSGTTFLHNLLTRDPSAAFISQYQTLFPHSAVTNNLARVFLKPMMPKTRPMDSLPVDLDSPQEGEMAMAVVGQAYYSAWYFSDYEDQLLRRHVLRTPDYWLDKYHVQLQKALLTSAGERLVLKNPANTARIPLLLSRYPGARFVHLVRDPFEVYCSSVRLYRKARPFFAHHRSNDRVPDKVISTYRMIMQSYLRDRGLIPDCQLIELRYEDLRVDPRRSVGRIYRRFDLELSDRFTSLQEEYLSSIGAYRPATYHRDGQIEERLRKEWAFAYDSFGY